MRFPPQLEQRQQVGQYSSICSVVGRGCGFRELHVQKKDHLRTKNWPESTGRRVLRMSNNACFLQNLPGVVRDSTHTSLLFYPRSKDKTDESETQPDFGLEAAIVHLKTTKTRRTNRRTPPASSAASPPLRLCAYFYSCV